MQPVWGEGRRRGGPEEALRAAGLGAGPAWSGRGDGWDSYLVGRTNDLYGPLDISRQSFMIVL